MSIIGGEPHWLCFISDLNFTTAIGSMSFAVEPFLVPKK